MTQNRVIIEGMQTTPHFGMLTSDTRMVRGIITLKGECDNVGNNLPYKEECIDDMKFLPSYNFLVSDNFHDYLSKQIAGLEDQ